MAADPLDRIRVDCYAGYRGEETPRRFYLDGRPIEVAEVLDRWLSPDHRYFKLMSAGGDTYILRHDSGSGDWSLYLYQRGPGRGPRLSS